MHRLSQHALDICAERMLGEPVQIQTGPAPGQRMRAWLMWTAAGELASIVVFTVLVWTVIQGQAAAWPFTVLGLLLLNGILLQGALYWLAKHHQVRHGSWPAIARLRLIRTLYVMNPLLLASFPATVLFTTVLAPSSVRAVDVLAGLALFLFACGEFVHYFLFKINMRPREWRAARAGGGPAPARFRRDLRRSEAAARRTASVRSSA